MSDDTEAETDLDEDADLDDGTGAADEVPAAGAAEEDPVAALMEDDDTGAGPGPRGGGILPQDLDLAPKAQQRQSAFMGVPIEVTVSIGRARPLVSELVKLRRDSVLTLDSKIEDPVELFIGDRLIARGELQEMDDETGQLGVRLTEVADLSGGV